MKHVKNKNHEYVCIGKGYCQAAAFAGTAACKYCNLKRLACVPGCPACLKIKRENPVMV